MRLIDLEQHLFRRGVDEVERARLVQEARYHAATGIRGDVVNVDLPVRRPIGVEDEGTESSGFPIVQDPVPQVDECERSLDLQVVVELVDVPRARRHVEARKAGRSPAQRHRGLERQVQERVGQLGAGPAAIFLLGLGNSRVTPARTEAHCRDP